MDIVGNYRCSKMRISLKSVENVIRETLHKYDVPETSIHVLINTIQYANQNGISTHGIRHLPMYVNKIKAGHLNPKDETSIELDSGALMLLDANRTFGQVAAKHAVDYGMDKANEYGISMIGVRNSNTIGAAGFFGDYTAVRGYATLIFANSAPAIAPTGGYKTIFGTNPICFSFPGSNNNNPIVLDMATTVAARSKIRLAAKNGEKIPIDWAIGPDGKATDDPNLALLGSLLPIAGYKGYGLSLFVDLLAGLMTGSAYAGAVKPLSDMSSDSKNGQLFIIIDVRKMMDNNELNERIDYFCQSVKSCGEDGKIMLPGEPGYRKASEQRESVLISSREYEDINRMAYDNGISVRLEKMEEVN